MSDPSPALAHGRRTLAVVGSAVALVAVHSPVPRALGLGPLLAGVLQVVGLVWFAGEAFGAELRDYAVAVWMTGGLAAYLVSVLVVGEVDAGDWTRQFALFVGAGLLVRALHRLEPDQITLERSTAELDAARAAAVPIADAVRDLPYLAAGLARLSVALRGSRLSKVLGLPDDADLLAELAHLRVAEPAVDLPQALVFTARYLPFNRTMEIRRDARSPEVVAHELLHALHHAAVMRALTLDDARDSLALLDKERTAAFIDELIDRVREGVAAGVLDEPLRWAVADLIFYAKLEDKAPMEAVGSYFDAAAARYVEKIAYYVALPFGLLAGMNRTNGIFQSFAGYLNHEYVADMERRGLVRALLTPRGF